MARKKETVKKAEAPSLAAFAAEASHVDDGPPAAAVPEAPDDVTESVAVAAKAFHVDLRKAARAPPAAAQAGPEIYLCPNCGAFIDPKAASCEHCGIAFEDGRQEAAPGPDVAPSVVPAAAPAPPVPEAPAAKPPKGKAKSAKAPATKPARKKR